MLGVQTVEESSNEGVEGSRAAGVIAAVTLALGAATASLTLLMPLSSSVTLLLFPFGTLDSSTSDEETGDGDSLI